MIDTDKLTWQFLAGIGSSLLFILVPVILLATTSIYPSLLTGIAVGTGIALITDMAVIPISRAQVDPSTDEYNVLYPIWVVLMVLIQIGAIPVGIMWTLITGSLIGAGIAMAIVVRGVIGVGIDIVSGQIELDTDRSTTTTDDDEWKYDPEDF